ncbi:unnamed protein product [Chrysoparadoxa australica]
MVNEALIAIGVVQRPDDDAAEATGQSAAGTMANNRMSMSNRMSIARVPRGTARPMSGPLSPSSSVARRRQRAGVGSKYADRDRAEHSLLMECASCMQFQPGNPYGQGIRSLALRAVALGLMGGHIVGLGIKERVQCALFLAESQLQSSENEAALATLETAYEQCLGDGPIALVLRMEALTLLACEALERGSLEEAENCTEIVLEWIECGKPKPLCLGPYDPVAAMLGIKSFLAALRAEQKTYSRWRKQLEQYVHSLRAKPLSSDVEGSDDTETAVPHPLHTHASMALVCNLWMSTNLLAELVWLERLKNTMPLNGRDNRSQHRDRMTALICTVIRDGDRNALLEATKLVRRMPLPGRTGVLPALYETCILVDDQQLLEAEHVIKIWKEDVKREMHKAALAGMTGENGANAPQINFGLRSRLAYAEGDFLLRRSCNENRKSTARGMRKEGIEKLELAYELACFHGYRLTEVQATTRLVNSGDDEATEEENVQRLFKALEIENAEVPASDHVLQTPSKQRRDQRSPSPESPSVFDAFSPPASKGRGRFSVGGNAPSSTQKASTYSSRPSLGGFVMKPFVGSRTAASGYAPTSAGGGARPPQPPSSGPGPVTATAVATGSGRVSLLSSQRRTSIGNSGPSMPGRPSLGRSHLGKLTIAGGSPNRGRGEGMDLLASARGVLTNAGILDEDEEDSDYSDDDDDDHSLTMGNHNSDDEASTNSLEQLGRYNSLSPLDRPT